MANLTDAAENAIQDLLLRGAAGLSLSVTMDAAGAVRTVVVGTPTPRSVVRALAPVRRVAAVPPLPGVAAIRPVRRVQARAA